MPTPEEYTIFEQDNSPDWFERAVDRMLASPKYGERWAGHWLEWIRQQLAADVLHPDRPEFTPALGFLAAGPWDQSTAATAQQTFDYIDRDDMLTPVVTTTNPIRFPSRTTMPSKPCSPESDEEMFRLIPTQTFLCLKASFINHGLHRSRYSS